MAEFKTNVMRILEKAKIKYNSYEYPHGKDALEGTEVAALMGQEPGKVFKTLVAKGKTGAYYVYDIPVDCQLDLKKAAKTVGEKSIEMVQVKDLIKIAGYPRGSVSPIGMKSKFKTVFHSSAFNYDSIYISGGKLGYQVELNPKELVAFVEATTEDIVK